MPGTCTRFLRHLMQVHAMQVFSKRNRQRYCTGLVACMQALVPNRVVFYFVQEAFNRKKHAQESMTQTQETFASFWY